MQFAVKIIESVLYYGTASSLYRFLNVTRYINLRFA